MRVDLARRGYTTQYEQVFDIWHVFYHGEFGRECVGTVTTPAAAIDKLDRQGWPTHIDPVLCPVCVTPEPEGAF